MVSPAVAHIELRAAWIFETTRDVVSSLHEGAEPIDDVLVATIESDSQALSGPRAPLHGVSFDDADPRPGCSVVGQVGPRGDLAVSIEVPLERRCDVEGAVIASNRRPGLSDDVLASRCAADDEFPR